MEVVMGYARYFPTYRPARREGARHWPFIVATLLFLLLVALGAFAGEHPQREGKLVGRVEALPASGLVGDWRVSGVVVHVSDDTRVDQEHGAVQVGAVVKAEGTFRTDGSLDAKEVEVLGNPGPWTPPPSGKSFAVLKLQPSPAAPVGAEGVALFRIFTSGDAVIREDLKVGVEHLLRAHTYDVYVDGVYAGAILTNDEGEGHLFLSTAPIPGAEPLPAELQPLAQRQRVEVRDGSTVVLAGNVADARWDGDGHPQREYLAVAPLATPQGVVLGLAVAEIKEGKQTLKVAAFFLPVSAPVTVLADGQVLGTVQTQANGFLHVIFSTQPEDDQLPLPEASLPVSSWQKLELKDGEGNTLVSGEFASVPHPGTATAPGQVRRRLGKPGR
ncbi:MAG: DUF5666 domain-containing protein [Thermoanaerobaculum sp.]